MVVSAGSIASSQQRSPRGSKNSGVSPVRSADGGQQNEQSDLNVTAASNKLLQVYSNMAVLIFYRIFYRIDLILIEFQATRLYTFLTSCSISIL